MPYPIKKKRKSGKFALDKHNNLLFSASPFWQQRKKLSGSEVYDGEWMLTSRKSLTFAFRKETTPDIPIALKTSLVSADAQNISFEISGTHNRGNPRTELLKLSGRWQVRKDNDLIFFVRRKESEDELAFGSGWEVDRDNQVVFNLEKRNQRIIRSFTIKGTWKLLENNKLAYALQGGRNQLEFKVSFGSENLYPKKGELKFRLGGGVKTRAQRPKVISLFGAWKIGRDLGLEFELQGAGKGGNRIEFASTLDLTRRDTIGFGLCSERNSHPVPTIFFSHIFLKKLDAETYLKLKSLKEEKSVEAGVRIPF